VNSTVEEYLTRGMLGNGFEKIFNNKAVVIVLVALFSDFITTTDSRAA